MDKIVLRHSRIEINNYELGDCPNLEYTFSVWDPTYHRSKPVAIEYNENKKQLRIPRGVDISYIKSLFFCEPIVNRQPDPYVMTDPIRIKYLPRDERQFRILKFLLGKEEYAYTSTKSQVAVNSSTASGKTFVTVATMCFTGSRMMIITSSLDWLEQWKNKILEYTPLTEKRIYMVKGSGSISKIFCRNPLDYQVFLVSHATIKSYGDTHGWDKVEELFQYLQCSMKVFDEAHLYFDNMAKIDFHSNTKKTIYLTASPERSSQAENEIYQFYFKNIPSIELFDEDNDPKAHYTSIHYNSHPNPIDIQNCKNRYGFDRNTYVTYVVDKESFNMLTDILIDRALNSNGKTLIFIGTNAGIKTVYDHIISQFPFLENYVGIYTSMVDKSEKPDNLKKKIILTTTKSCGTAMDIADLGGVINLAEPFNSSVLAKQSIGRCRVPGTTYTDVVDMGFYHTKKYYTYKKPIFDKLAKTCSKEFISDEDLVVKHDEVINKYNNSKVMCMPVYKK